MLAEAEDVSVALFLLLINDTAALSKATAASGLGFVLVNLDASIICLVFCFLEDRFFRAATFILRKTSISA